MEDFVYDLFEQIVQFASVSIWTQNSVFLQRFFTTNGEKQKNATTLVNERACFKLLQTRVEDHKSEEGKYFVTFWGDSVRLLYYKPFWEDYYTRTLILPPFLFVNWSAITFKKNTTLLLSKFLFGTAGLTSQFKLGKSHLFFPDMLCVISYYFFVDYIFSTFVSFSVRVRVCI